jgi:hypothetical protein
MNMLGRDIWVKYTNKSGQTWTSHHVVWDVGLFMKTREAEAKKEGGTAEQVLKPK